MGDKGIRISAKKLSFSYGKDADAIRNVSLDLYGGKITALVGANGCGKSTLFGLLTGGLKPCSGTVYLDETPIEKIKRRDFAKQVAVVHQNNSAPDDLTIRRLVSLGRTPYRSLFSRSYSSEDNEAVMRALALTDTEKYADRMISQLSGGQKQRVWLAMALAQSTDILLLDEFTTYLDIHYQLELLSVIKDLNKDRHITVLMVMHDINQALEYSDEIIVMTQGEVLDCGPTDRIVTESTLDKAFNIKSHITEIENRRYCVFKNRERKSRYEKD